MPISAMPEHLNSREEIEAAFPDDSQYGDGWFGRLYKWYHKETKTWFAFSYRCTEWWARWRKYPKVLFAVRGNGRWRFETPVSDFATTEGMLVDMKWQSCYMSRIQYYCRWHIAIQWPLMVSFHFYPKVEDVPVYGQPLDSKKLKGKVWFGYWNHFDADLVYWMVTSAYLGRNWK